MINSSTGPKYRKVVFLDRDGVINRDSPDYIKSWDEFEFLPGSLEALKRLTGAGFAVIVITNQSAVGRRMISFEELERIHLNMQEVVSANGGRITDIFFCPHTPDVHCGCRKPEPGLIRQAQKRHVLDLESAYMVGDSARDIECAQKAGCGHALLVRTGNGIAVEIRLAEKRIRPDYVAENLYDAVDWIIAHDRLCHAAIPTHA